AGPVDVRRSRDDLSRAGSDDGADGGQAELRAQLRAAEERRDRVAQRVDALRARVNVPVVTDVDEYQRLQDALQSALDQLDRAEAEVARLRRGLAEGE